MILTMLAVKSVDTLHLSDEIVVKENWGKTFITPDSSSSIAEGVRRGIFGDHVMLEATVTDFKEFFEEEEFWFGCGTPQFEQFALRTFAEHRAHLASK